LGVAGKRAVCQWEAVAGYDQRHDDLFAVAAVCQRALKTSQ
jgi:hypothetical protein